MERRAVTMRQVAKEAGVSLKTVSRVVNGEEGVSAELLGRVQTALGALEYRPNVAAGSLRRGRTRSIGVLVQDVANDFSAALLRAIDDVAVAAGVAVFSASLDEEPTRERDVVANLVSRRVDGLVLVPATSDQSYLEPDIARGLEVVVVDRDPQGLDVDCVLTDNVLGASEGVHHLVDHGHRRVALLADSSRIWTSAQRREGWAAALRERGIEPDDRLVRTGIRSAGQAARATADLLSEPDPPTAFFAARNVFSIGAVRALQRLERSHDVALVGFDDFPMADLVDPGVTVVHQSVEALGRTAAQYLLDRVGGTTVPARRTVLPTSVLERGSGEIPAPRRGLSVDTDVEDD